jgi:serine-type D-Ala-D-Ala carboxypeptidase (penicillin-binding protein 5/6)
MRLRHFLLLATVLVFAFGTYGFVLYKRPVPALASKNAALATADLSDPSLTWPKNSEAAIGAEGFGVLASHGEQKAHPTASVTKVMLAVTILKKYPLALGETGPTLTMTQADVNSYNAYVAEDGSVAKVALGEKITEYQALEALLLPSADNIADTLAKWAYGSIGNYSVAANSLAATLGMSDSHFGTTDASGYSPDTVSTAQDLVLLGQEALKNPVIAQIVAKPTASVPVAGTIRNVNWMLGTDGINGIKTGNTDQAGGVYLFSAKRTFTDGQSVTIIGVVMDTSSTLAQALNDSLPLLRSAEKNFTLTTLVNKGQVMGAYDVPWAKKVTAVASGSLTAVTWQGQDVTPKVSLRSLSAPVAKGTRVGTVSFSVTSKTVPVVIEQDIAAPSWQWRLTHAL